MMKFLASLVHNFLQQFVRDSQNREIGASQQRESNQESKDEQLEVWSEIDSDSVSPSDAADGLSSFGETRFGNRDPKFPTTRGNSNPEDTIPE